jgi:hypothetical protein
MGDLDPWVCEGHRKKSHMLALSAALQTNKKADQERLLSDKFKEFSTCWS